MIQVKFIIKSLLVSLLSILLCWNADLLAQKKIPSEFCITPQEKILFDQLNNLIEDYGNPRLKLSTSLSYVARVHINDLLNNHPDTSICNLSSWSDKGDWTSCCHNPYVPQQDCMWDKPKELTTYPYRGYELICYFEDVFTYDSVLNLWAGSKEVLDMLLANGNFSKKNWICMGVAQNKHYASVWLGQRADKVKKPVICKDSTDTFIVGDSLLSIENFYVIFGSFSTIRDAKEAHKRLKKNGFDDAGILTSSNNFRIYLKEFSNVKEAMYYKQKLPYTYREAWIFRE